MLPPRSRAQSPPTGSPWIGSYGSELNSMQTTKNTLTGPCARFVLFRYDGVRSPATTGHYGHPLCCIPSHEMFPTRSTTHVRDVRRNTRKLDADLVVTRARSVKSRLTTKRSSPKPEADETTRDVDQPHLSHQRYAAMGRRQTRQQSQPPRRRYARGFRQQESKPDIPKRYACGPGTTILDKPKRNACGPIMRPIGVATLNVGTLTGKSIELIDSMKRRNLAVMCLSETKWKGESARDLADGYRLYYYGTDTKRNGVGIILAPNLADNVIKVQRISDRLMCVTVETNGVNVHFVSAYFPQTGCRADEKDNFRQCFLDFLQTIPNQETVIVGTDGNAHVGAKAHSFTQAHGGHGYGEINDDGTEFLLMCEALNLTITNTWFRKRDSHLVTYASGKNSSQIDFVLVRRNDLKLVTNCRVWPGENLTSQHRLVVASIRIPLPKRQKVTRPKPRIRWWKLKQDSHDLFYKAIAPQLPDPREICSPWDSEFMWQHIEDLFHREANRLFGSGTGVPPKKQSWWWKEELRESIAKKKACLKKAKQEKTPEAWAEYKLMNKETKKVVAQAKVAALNDLYTEIEDIRANPSLVYKIAKARNRAKQDVKVVKSVKSLDGTVLTKPEDTINRWREHYDNLLNEEFPRIIQQEHADPNVRVVPEFSFDEIQKALAKMKPKKALGPDAIPIEAWKALGRTGIVWLQMFFNQIMKLKAMPSSWRLSTLVSIYKNKGDPRDCGSYRPIKLLSHTMKLFERVLDHRIRKEARLEDYQCGFRPGRGTTDAIFVARQAIEKRRVKKEPNVHIGFIDLEKAYDRVPRDILWEALRWKGVSEQYVQVIQDMYHGAMTIIRTPLGDTAPVCTKVGLHQGSAISPLLFTLCLDYCSKNIKKSQKDTIAYADDILVMQPNIQDLEQLLNQWCDALKDCGLRVNIKKTEFMSSDERATVSIDGVPLNKVSHFRYLGSEITPGGENTEEVHWRISRGWAKFRETSGILCDKRISRKLKGKVYRTAVRPALLYGAETWGPLATETKKIQVAEMRMLRWACGYTRLDRKRNDFIRSELAVAPIDLKQRESRLRWYGHIHRHKNDIGFQATTEVVAGTGRRGAKKKGWSDIVKTDMDALRITEDDTNDRVFWRNRTRHPDPVTDRENR